MRVAPKLWLRRRGLCGFSGARSTLARWWCWRRRSSAARRVGGAEAVGVASAAEPAEHAPIAVTNCGIEIVADVATTMTNSTTTRRHERSANLRRAIIGVLPAGPPECGELRAAAALTSCATRTIGVAARATSPRLSRDAHHISVRRSCFAALPRRRGTAIGGKRCMREVAPCPRRAYSSAGASPSAAVAQRMMAPCAAQ